MTAEVIVPFPVQPDLAATMDIQIPALAWQPSGSGAWQRTYRTGGTVTEVTVTEDDHALRFRADQPLHASTTLALGAVLRRQFPRQVSTLHLDGHPVLAAMSRHYQGVIIMSADPFEALILTVLSQNRTGEIVRKVYPRLEARCGGMTPGLLASLDERDLAEVIRSAGPYKAGRLASAARRIAAEGPDLFAKTITQAPAGQAMEYLTSLPGVGHKTAACVLVFAAQTDRNAAGRHPPVPRHPPPRPDQPRRHAHRRHAGRGRVRHALLRPRPRGGAFPVPPPRPHHLHRRAPPLR